MAADSSPAIADSNKNPEGRIFAGHSFYISHRVPCRQSFSDFIIANGGLSVQVDSKADFIIVNPYKESTYDTLVYSFKYLEDCRKDQQLKDIEEYIVWGKGENAAIALTAPRKYRGWRAPFTEKDDQILLNWINRPNVRIGGNKVYKELEAQYPHHSWHAWRSRWYDQLSKIMPDGPRPSQVIKFDNVACQDEQPQFTSADDQILMDMRDEIVNAPNKKVIYCQIHEKYPHHSDVQWKNRFKKVLLPLMDRVGTESGSEELSPRHSEVTPEELPNPHVYEAVVLADQLQHSNGLPPPKREALRKTFKRRASDPVVSISTMGQSQSTSISKRPVSQHSISQRVKVPQDPSLGSVVNHTPPPEQPHTPTCHSTQLVKPPRSPMDYAARDVMSSPRVKTDAEVSPVEQHVRVQQWRADVSRHATGESANDEDQAIQAQIQNEISEKTQQLPCYSKSTPSPIVDSMVSNKRKREVHSEGLVTPKTLLTKRARVAAQAKAPVFSTLDSINMQLLSTPAPPSTKRSRDVSQRSSISSDPADGPKLVTPISKVGNNREPYYKMSTQAIYDNITSDEEELLVNVDITGLEDGSEEEDLEDLVSSFKDDDVFDTRKLKGANRGKGFKLATGTLDFDKGFESVDMDEVSDQGSEDVDEEIARREVAEAAIYLVEKAAQWGVTQKDVIDAIERTSGEKMLVDVVLKLKTENKGLPTNIPGVWMPQDDEGLQGNDARIIALLEEKHGDRVLERMDWLQKWREA